LIGPNLTDFDWINLSTVYLDKPKIKGKNFLRGINNVVQSD